MPLAAPQSRKRQLRMLPVATRRAGSSESFSHHSKKPGRTLFISLTSLQTCASSPPRPSSPCCWRWGSRPPRNTPVRKTHYPSQMARCVPADAERPAKTYSRRRSPGGCPPTREARRRGYCCTLAGEAGVQRQRVQVQEGGEARPGQYSLRALVTP